MKIDFVSGAISYCVFLASLTLHEAAHAWSAWKLGDHTAYHGGQVSLDPTPHIRRSPFGMVVVPILTYMLNGWMLGWASTPYNPQWALEYPRRNALMSMAGPAANLLLVLIAAGVMLIGVRLGALEILDHPSWSQVAAALQGGVWPFLAYVLSITFSLNLLLLLFNLAPVPPLDGASLAMFFLPRDQAQRYWAWTHRGGFGIIGLILMWQVFGYVFWPAWKCCVRILHG